MNRDYKQCSTARNERLAPYRSSNNEIEDQTCQDLPLLNIYNQDITDTEQEYKRECILEIETTILTLKTLET